MKKLSRTKNILMFSWLWCVMFCLAPSASVSQWMRTPIPYSVTNLMISGPRMLAGTNGGGIYRSSDNGLTYAESNRGMLNNYVTGLTRNGPTFYASTSNAGVYRSVDSGSTWKSINGGLTELSVKTIVTYGGDLVAGTATGIVRFTADNAQWTLLKSMGGVNALAVIGPNLLVGTSSGVVITSDYGKSWMAINAGLTDLYVTCFAISSSNLYAGGFGGVFRLNADGASWTRTVSGLRTTAVYALCAAGNSLFAALGGAGVARSLDNGNSWSPINTGIADDHGVKTLAATDTYLFAGNQDGVWRNPVNAMTTDVASTSASLPQAFSLGQNYPNPFNPSTEISFHIPARSFVRLTIFDAMGREVSTIVAEERMPGEHTVRWNASGCPSGVYFYRIQTGAGSIVRSMLLLK